MVHDPRSQAGLLDLAVEEQHGAGPAQVDIRGFYPGIAQDDTGVGRIVGNGIDHGAGIARTRVRAITAGGNQFQGGHHAVGGLQHLIQADILPGQVMFHDEGQLHLDAGVGEPAGGDAAAIGEQHIVQQYAVVRGINFHGHLHGAGGQADLVTDDPAALRQLARHPALLHRVGVLEIHARVGQRERGHLPALQLRAVQGCDGVGNLLRCQHDGTQVFL